MWTAGIRVFGRCAIYPVCEIIQPCTTQCIARTIRKAKISCKQACLNLQHKNSSHHLVHFNNTQRSSILLPIFLFIFTLLWTFFQWWYDWLMFRGVGQLRCWCRVRGNSKLPIILGLTSQQLNVLLDVEGRAFSRPTAVWASTRDVATSRQDNPSGTFAESSSHCYRNCP